MYSEELLCGERFFVPPVEQKLRVCHVEKGFESVHGWEYQTT